MKGSFATRIAGSADLYQVNKRKPYHGINFIIAHDGFMLYDLVSYNYKHNDANGEGGNDGCNDNFSWNCGFEGEIDDTFIEALRLRQMKNFHVALMVSQGTPMMLMGGEYGHTRYGNNNSYGHDNALNHLQWGQLKDKKKKFRRSRHLFTRENFISKGTSLDGTFAPGLIGYANAYAAQLEGDQAMSAYCTAAQLFRGLKIFSCLPSCFTL